MLGCQFVFHCPDSSASLASVWYAHRSGTPGNVQVNDNLAVAEDPSRETDATVTPGFSGPMPVDQRLEQVIDRCAGGAHERQRREILRAQPRRQRGGRLVSSVAVGSGFGLGGNIPQPATARTRISSRHPKSSEELADCRMAGLGTPGHPATLHRRG